MRRNVAFFLCFLLGTASGSPLLAWGEKGHELVSDAATRGLPAELPPFFHKAYGELIYLANDPDRWRGAGQSADDTNPPEHFLDYEYVAHLDLPRGRNDFIALLYSSGTIRAHLLEPGTAGFVIWEIAETTETLTDQWRRWRRMPPGHEREQVEKTIVFLAGTLSHYIADSANPHHATIHYNGWVGDPTRGFRNDCDAHGRFESVFVTNNIELADVTARMAPPQERSDAFAEALALIRDSNANVERLYGLDAEGAFDYPAGSAAGKAFAAERLALGASILRDYWWSAWVASGKPRSRGRSE
ncbi:MAG TPA: nuclease [Thermoanaerobaculia bacterium]|nr:nuclease [Thermoanaerobaculia bacterium]